MAKSKLHKRHQETQNRERGKQIGTETKLAGLNVLVYKRMAIKDSVV